MENNNEVKLKKEASSMARTAHKWTLEYEKREHPFCARDCADLVAAAAKVATNYELETEDLVKEARISAARAMSEWKKKNQ